MASTDMQFEAPIPGQSLTEPPGNRPYERPPEIVDADEAIQMHLSRLTEPERLEAVVDAIELGTDIRSLTTGLLRSAVAQGIHTVDISLLIAPVIHEFIKATAEDAGLEYDEGFVDEEAEERRRRTIQYAKAKRKLEKKGYIKESQGTEEAIPTGGEELPAPSGEPDSESESRGIVKRRTKETKKGAQMYMREGGDSVKIANRLGEAGDTDTFMDMLDEEMNQRRAK